MDRYRHQALSDEHALSGAIGPAPSTLEELLGAGMIGVIADDFTGATDVATAFRRAGLRTSIIFGPPTDDVALPPSDVVVVALKTRTTSPEVAIEQSLSTARRLLDDGATQLYFKICSTFDSTPRGNIGPVADALVDLHGADLAVVVVPSSPQHERRQLFGHLFVGTVLLSDSSMHDHPLTPMTDSRIPELLQHQTHHRVGLIDIRTVGGGPTEVRHALAAARVRGERYAVVDAVTPADLDAIGEAVRDAPVVVGAAGLAAGIARAWSQTGGATKSDEHEPSTPAVPTLRGVAIAGSCSARTLEQVNHMRASAPSHRVDALDSADPSELARRALAWFDTLPEGDTALIYTSLPPQELRHVQDVLGIEKSSAILEDALSEIARGLVDRGIQRLVVAGGETSGAVVEGLGIPAAVIGQEAATGVPWVHSLDGRNLVLLLKSGNFGDPDLLTIASASGPSGGIL